MFNDVLRLAPHVRVLRWVTRSALPLEKVSAVILDALEAAYARPRQIGRTNGNEQYRMSLPGGQEMYIVFGKAPDGNGSDCLVRFLCIEQDVEDMLSIVRSAAEHAKDVLNASAVWCLQNQESST